MTLGRPADIGQVLHTGRHTQLAAMHLRPGEEIDVEAHGEAQKLCSRYAPPEHPHATVHRTRAEADAAEAEHGH